VLVDGDQLIAEPGVGQFVKRARFGESLGARSRMGLAAGAR
jgi:hypothetical protein